MATTLSAGDIAIIGFNYDNPDEFAFVPLVDLSAGTEINFTDNGWQAAGSFRATEGTFTWTAPTPIAAGTVINPTISSILFSASGDQIIAYQGDASNPTFIYALNSEGNPGVWQSDSTSSNTSALPTGLVNGETAVALDEIDNAIYTGITSGSKAELLAAISDQSNWSGSNSTRQTLPTNAFSVSGTGGSNPLINEVYVSHTGTDDTEFIEIFGTPGTSLEGLSFIGIEGDSGSAIGTIDARFDFDATHVIGDNGFFLVGNPTGLTNNYGVTPNADISNNFLENSSSTFALVETSSLSGTSVTGSEGVIDTVALTDGGVGDTFFFDAPIIGPDGPFLPAGARRVTDRVDTDTVADWVISDFFLGADNTPTAGTADVIIPEPTLVPIYTIQGAGHASALDSQTVTTTGIVTAVDTNGFYLQDATGDNDIATSDAIFVFTGSAPGVSVGDELQVEGTVSEFTPGGTSTRNLSTTQISGSPTITTLSTGNALPVATIIGASGRVVPSENIDDDAFASFDPETDGIDFFESLEGMLVTAEDLVAVSGTNQFDEIFAVVNQGANATGISDRGTLNISPDDFNPEKIQIDEDSGIFDFDFPEVNVGDTLGDVTGVVGYGFGNFEIYPTQDFTANIQSAGLQPDSTSLVGTSDQLTVASYNVLNLDPVIEVQANTNGGQSRNVDDDLGNGRFEAIAQQIVSNLNAPDIIGLQEIQDNTGGEIVDDIIAADVTLQTLIDAIAAAGGPTYEFIDNTFITDEASGGQPGGNIRNAYLYNPDRVDVVDGSVQTISGQGAGEAFEGARLPLVATFDFNGEDITVVNNHFSSKGGSAPILGIEQPFDARQEDVTVNGSLDERQRQSAAVQGFVSGVLAADANANVVVLGDLNEFEFVSPVTGLEDAGLTNLTNTVPENERYTFNFQGNSQSLDHILVSDSLNTTAEFDIVHVNSEFARTSSTASDHDPLLARFTFAPVEPEVFTLELLHAADQEASAAAIQDAPNFSAVLNALRGQDLGNDGLADNTLTLSSGDAIIPGLFFNASEAVFGSAGIADIQIQNELGFQAIALGNHEFDFGTGTLAGLIDGSAPGDLFGQDFTGTDFPYLSANLDFSTDANLAPLAVAGGQAPQANVVTSSTVIDVNGESIGVVGATTPTLGSISNPGDVSIAPAPFGANPTPAELDALAAEIQTEVNVLLATDPSLNKVVLLSHMQQLDIERALAQRLENVDIIVGGGSNTRLFDESDRPRAGDSVQGDYPEFIDNAGGTKTALVNTDGSYKYVGRLVIDFDADGNIIPESYDATVSGAYATDDQGVADLNAENLVDPEIQQIVDAIEAQIIATEGNVFGISDVFLNGNRSGIDTPENTDGVRTQETNLGNLTADANLAEAQDADPTVVISLKNGGGIRASIGQTVVPAGGTEAVRLPNEAVVDSNGNVIKPEGGISQNDIQTTLAFNNGLVLLTLTKAEVVGLLEHGVGAIPSVSGRFAQLSGVKFSYDPDFPEGQRIINAGVFDEDDNLIAELVRDGAIAGDTTEEFRIVSLDFLVTPRFDDDGNFVGGGDGYPFPNLSDPEVFARVNPVLLEQEGVATGGATFADNGTEQDALAEYLLENFSTPEIAFGQEDVGRTLDDRIQNVNFREDTVLGDIVTPVADLEVGLFDADTNELITLIGNGTEILESDLTNRSITIAAFVPEESDFFGDVGSIELNLNNGQEVQVENAAPYALFGDRRGDFRGRKDFLADGENTIEFDLFTGRRLRGNLLGSVSRSFEVVDDIPDTPIDGFALEIGLYNTITDELIAPLENGSIISVGDLADGNLTIAAFAVGDVKVGSLELDLNNGEVVATENAEPYALFGDRRGDFSGGSLALGQNTIEFEAYSQRGLNGESLGTTTLDFTLVESVFG